MDTQIKRRIFDQLAGAWDFDRQIPEHNLHITGRAFFGPDLAYELAYREEGELHHPDGSVNEVFRHYIYRLDENDLSVFFGDGPDKGALFHTLIFDDNQERPYKAKGEHLCKQDLYRAFYHFLSDERFDLTYRVTGPKKHYRIVTRYTRKQAPEPASLKPVYVFTKQ